MAKHHLSQDRRWRWTAIVPMAAMAGSIFLSHFILLVAPAAEGADVVDRIVAVVNDDIILLSELDAELQPIISRIQAAGYSSRQRNEMIYKYREDLLKRMIDEKLTKQEIENQKISVSEQEIDNAIEQIKRKNLYTDAEFRDMLTRQGTDMEAYRSLVKNQILQNKLVNREIKSKIVITPVDIKAHYDKNSDKYKGEKQYHLRNLMMPMPSFADERDREDAKKRMESILVRLKSGQTFDKTNTVGKDIGFVGEKKLSSQLQTALKDLKAGDFTQVLDTDQGFQIFFVQDIRVAAGKSLADASDEIERELYDDIMKNRFKTWLDELRKNSHIKIIR